MLVKPEGFDCWIYAFKADGKTLIKFVKGWWIDSIDSQGITTTFKYMPLWDGPIEKYMNNPNYQVHPIFYE
jgi:hypothetical protein